VACANAGGKGGSTPYDDSINEQFADDLEHYKPLAAHYPEVDLRDLKVADKWVQRHPHLIRLTGVHPFNVEPPLPELLDYGFYSPVNLHIVRNHGAVPKIKWEEHRRTQPALSWRLCIVQPESRVRRPLAHPLQLCAHALISEEDGTRHAVTVKGNVGKRLTLTMDQIEKMPAISFPCLVTCAGNRCVQHTGGGFCTA
jgi:hypothetical protein